MPDYHYLKPIPDELSVVELFAYLDKAEKEIKEAKEQIKKQSVKIVGETENKFFKTDYGNVQWVSKETKKIKDSLKFYLRSKGVLDLCKKDEIDLSKVLELTDAGILAKDEVYEHVEINTTNYLKVK